MSSWGLKGTIDLYQNYIENVRKLNGKAISIARREKYIFNEKFELSYCHGVWKKEKRTNKTNFISQSMLKYHFLLI